MGKNESGEYYFIVVTTTVKKLYASLAPSKEEAIKNIQRYSHNAIPEKIFIQTISINRSYEEYER